MPFVQAPYPPGSGAVGAVVPSRHSDIDRPDLPSGNDHIEDGDPFPGWGEAGDLSPTRETVPPAISAQYPGVNFPPGFVTPSRETVPPAVNVPYPGGLFPAGSTQPSRETIPPAIGSGVLSYSQQVIADGAVAYWRLGDGVGSAVAVDAIGGHNGAVVGVVTFGQPGAVSGNTAALLDGASGRATTPTPIPLAAAFTLEAWVNFPSAASASALPILAGDMFMDGGFAWQIRGSNQSTIIFVDATAGTVYGQILMTLSAWHHVVTTYDGITIRHYVDGVADAFLAKAVNPALGAQAPQIGCDFRQPAFFAGMLDEVAIYQRCLTPAQILAHYNAR